MPRCVQSYRYATIFRGMARRIRQHLGQRKRRSAGRFSVLSGWRVWLGWRIGDVVERLRTGFRGRPGRGHRAMKGGRTTMTRRLAAVAIAIALGVTIGELAGGRHRPHETSRTPPKPVAGSNVVELPLVERLAAAAQTPPPAAVPSPPPKLITSHEDPQVVYEEVTPEPSAGKQSGGAPERDAKPTLLANLANFASKP